MIFFTFFLTLSLVCCLTTVILHIVLKKVEYFINFAHYIINKYDNWISRNFISDFIEGKTMFYEGNDYYYLSLKIKKIFIVVTPILFIVSVVFLLLYYFI